MKSKGELFLLRRIRRSTHDRSSSKHYKESIPETQSFANEPLEVTRDKKKNPCAHGYKRKGHMKRLYRD